MKLDVTGARLSKHNRKDYVKYLFIYNLISLSVVQVMSSNGCIMMNSKLCGNNQP
jgi:hypothetical protein